MDDIERLVTGLVENLARSDLNVMDEAAGLFRLVEYGLSVSALAKRLGRSGKHVSTRLALLELPKAAQTELEAGRLTVAEATALLALRHHPDAIDSLLADDYSRGDIDRAVIRETTRIEAEKSRRGPRRAGGGRRGRRYHLHPASGPRPLGAVAVLGCCAAHAVLVGGVAATSIARFGIPAILLGGVVAWLWWGRCRR